jgi:uncharacterized protein
MFPLGTVLLPGAYLPLHVFEERYRVLVRTCLASEREFGVTLIERGSEVGGGDTRTLVGTRARIVEAVELDDGRWALGTVGGPRLRVVRWLADDPHPWAEVEDWPDDPTPGSSAADVGALADAAVARLRRLLGVDLTGLSDDPELASYQLAMVSPFGPADQQALLESGSTAGRLARLDELLGELETDLGI